MTKRTFLRLASGVLVAPLISSFKNWTYQIKLKNWAGNLEYSTSDVHYPRSIEEIQQLVKKFDNVKALGTRHCFNDIADSRHHLISLKEMNKVVAERIALKDSEHWAIRLTEYRIPYALVNDYIQALEDPQVKHRGLLHEVDHPVSGKIKVVGPPWRMSNTPTEVRSPPTLGQHTAEVLQEWLGINEQELK